MDENKRFEKGMQIRKEVLGEEHVERSLANANAFNDAFQDLTTRYAWGEIWSRPELSKRSRSLITLAMLIALNRTPEFQLHVKAALNNGVSIDEIKEVVLQSAVYCGLPAAHSAFHSAQEVFDELNLEI
ncbi:MAG: 4-carboxymuconolactone decarboxylase [Candidatus Poribacteria bacterium]|nr:4-carboxymuconolactone decarboxylase [Candidatus Poribacteria bacterium]MDE0503122.1 4-carboxymuconolactone decarboxylase [Candidatus Poribacteria bacterium]